ncbi:unnamed protein product [Closterium sp. NIES-65]|nr:unnamed protein product [Closterium sp. NIES-65]
MIPHCHILTPLPWPPLPWWAGRQQEGEVRQLQREVQEARAARDATADELLRVSQRLLALEKEQVAVPALEAELAGLRARHEVALVMVGERNERVDELEADLADVRALYKEQVALLAGQVCGSRHRGAWCEAQRGVAAGTEGRGGRHRGAWCEARRGVVVHGQGSVMSGRVEGHKGGSAATRQWLGHAWLLLGHAWLLLGHAWLLLGHAWLLLGHAWLLLGHAWLLLARTAITATLVCWLALPSQPPCLLTAFASSLSCNTSVPLSSNAPPPCPVLCANPLPIPPPASPRCPLWQVDPAKWPQGYRICLFCPHCAKTQRSHPK